MSAPSMKSSLPVVTTILLLTISDDLCPSALGAPAIPAAGQEAFSFASSRRGWKARGRSRGDPDDHIWVVERRASESRG